MKKLIWIFPVLSVLSCNQNNKDFVDFKVQYKPESTYNQTMTENAKMESKYDGSAVLLQELKNSGIENPSKKENHVTIIVALKTGKMNGQNVFPFTMAYLKTTSKDSNKEIPDSTIFYGKDTVGRTPVIDSVFSKGMKEDMKRILIQSVENTLQQSCNPERTLKIGEQFISQAPMNMQMGIINLQLTITTTYILKSVKDNLANFDISQVYTINSTITEHTFKAEGEGKGKIVYDMKDNYYKDYNVDVVLGMSMDISGLYAEINTESTIDIQTTLVKN